MYYGGMDINYKEVISFSGIKTVLDESGIKYGFIAEKIGIRGDVLGRIFRNEIFPKTDLIAKIACVLKLPVSQIVEFKMDVDEKKRAWFENKVLPYSPDGEMKGEVTYEPLRLMMTMYLDYINAIKDSDKTVDDLFDMIEPYRRRNGLVVSPTKEIIQKSLVARGYDKDYKSKRTDRKYRAKGLTPQTRTKIKNDRPLNIRTVYDICNFFGCSIDWVMGCK